MSGDGRPVVRVETDSGSASLPVGVSHLLVADGALIEHRWGVHITLCGLEVRRPNAEHAAATCRRLSGTYPITTSPTPGSAAICSTTLAWRQLRRCGHVPAVSLMPFLEDARERGVLRTVGGVYQFRHATLQDQLADRGLAGVVESTARSVSVAPGRSGDR